MDFFETPHNSSETPTSIESVYMSCSSSPTSSISDHGGGHQSQADLKNACPYSSALCCPDCKDSFSYLQREGFGERLPMTLSCGHKLCFLCLKMRMDLGAITNELVAGKKCTSFSCCVCGCNQPKCSSSKNKDIAKLFPVNMPTIGALVVLDKFGKDYLPQAFKPLKKRVMTLQPSISIDLNREEQVRKERIIDCLDRCSTCRKLAVEWNCLSCSKLLCYRCFSDHCKSCSSESSSMVPCDEKGGVHSFNKCITHGETCDWFCGSHPEHRYDFRCIECVQQSTISTKCVFKNLQHHNGSVFSELKLLLSFVQEVRSSTADSLANLMKAPDSLRELHAQDREAIVWFFSRLSSSAMFSCNSLIFGQIAIDKKRLFILQGLRKSLQEQSHHLSFLNNRWKHLTKEYRELGVDLAKEEKLFLDVLMNAWLWNPNRLFEKRVKRERLIGANWDNGLPTGLRTTIAKCRSEITLSDQEIGSGLDFEPVHLVINTVQDQWGCILKYEFTDVMTSFPSAQKESIARGNAISLLRKQLFNVDGLIPRNWFPEHQKVIDSSPLLCQVTHINDQPDVFWIRVSDRLPEFEVMQDFLQSCCPKAPCATLEEVLEDTVFAALVSTNAEWSIRRVSESRLWMRVRVTKKLADKQGYTVFLLDVGTSRKVLLSDLKKIPRHIQSIKPFALRATLSDFVPYWQNVRGAWSPKARAHFVTWLKNVGSPFVVLDDMEGDTLVVDIWSDLGSIAPLKEFLMVCAVGTLRTLSDAWELHKR